MSMDLREIDQQILAALVAGRHADEPWGRESTGRIADRVDRSPQNVISRLEVLQAAGYVDKISRGLYEITPAGIETSDG